jgi:hypothetical protein
MRQLRDTAIWLAMMSVVAGVIYVMPQVAAYVDAASESQRGSAIVPSREVTVPYHRALSHRHH